MMYLLAILFPPAAVLLCGKPIEALLNCFLTLLFWVPGVIHAMLVVSSSQADARTGRVVGAIKKQERAVKQASKAAVRQTQRDAPAPIAANDGRVPCADCGYRNQRSRTWCKHCRVQLSSPPLPLSPLAELGLSHRLAPLCRERPLHPDLTAGAAWSAGQIPRRYAEVTRGPDHGVPVRHLARRG